MSSINGIGSNSPIQKPAMPAATGPVAPSSASESSSRPSDKLDLSGTSPMLQTEKSTGFRPDKVASIRAQIEKGTYDEGAKLDIVADRLLDDILK